MEHRKELLLANCKLAKALVHRPMFFLGETILVSGLLSTDYNLQLQDLFKSAVATPPDEDYEENSLIVYMTRSQATAAKLHAYAANNKAPAVEVVIITYHEFDGNEVMDRLADLEDGTKEVRCLIVEDFAGFSYHDQFAQETKRNVRIVRNAAVNRFVFVTSGFLGQDASTQRRMCVDSEEFLKSISGRGYERPRNLGIEYDISFLVAASGYDEESLELYQDILISKCRGILTFDRDVITNTSFKFGSY